MLASKFFKELAEVFDDRAHAGGKYSHFPWETLAEEKWPGEVISTFPQKGALEEIYIGD